MRRHVTKNLNNAGSRPVSGNASLNSSTPQILQRPAPQQGAPLFGAPRPKRLHAPANPGSAVSQALESITSSTPPPAPKGAGPQLGPRLSPCPMHPQLRVCVAYGVAWEVGRATSRELGTENSRQGGIWLKGAARTLRLQFCCMNLYAHTTQLSAQKAEW